MNSLRVGMVGFDITPRFHPAFGAWGSTHTMTELDLPLLARCIALATATSSTLQLTPMTPMVKARRWRLANWVCAMDRHRHGAPPRRPAGDGASPRSLHPSNRNRSSAYQR
jgi:hypothetical protein